MAGTFVGEIRLFAGNFAPAGWSFCDGQTIPIVENETLFQLIGTTYGGDGQSTFQLPNLTGRVPVHMGTGVLGTNYQIGEMAGVEQVTLTAQQIPNHTHPLLGSNNVATSPTPTTGGVFGIAPAAMITPYGVDLPIVALNAQTVGAAGGSQPHDNMQPYVGLNYIISLYGVFPSQT